jgi:hypothetical protein
MSDELKAMLDELDDAERAAAIAYLTGPHTNSGGGPGGDPTAPPPVKK